MEKEKTLLVASGNKGKIKEIADMLYPIKVMGYKDLGIDIEIEENGSTFFENALIKARAIYNLTKVPTLADDSGLCVDILGGAPGIYSARYSNDGDDQHNIDKLLFDIKEREVADGGTNRNAKFVCCMVYYDGKNIIVEHGETKGKILGERRGTNGFGYDPVFFSDDLNKSMGESSSEEKNKVSHRSRALNKIKKRII